MALIEDVSEKEYQETLSGFIGKSSNHKLKREKQYAVLVSGGFGAGFSTWCNIKAHDFRLFYILIYRKCIQGNQIKFESREHYKLVEKDLHKVFGKDNYTSGLVGESVRIEWLGLEDDYIIKEFDGYETLEIM